MDDAKLAAAIAINDREAVRRLFELHFDSLYRFLYSLTRHADDAEDLAQQTLLRVLRNAGRYDGRIALRSWIFAIAYREFGRWSRRRLLLPLPWSLEAKDNLAEEAANAALLLDVLSKLSAAHRAAVLLHYVEGLSIEEIAAVQSVPAGTVKSRLHFARAHLQGLLEQEEFYVPKPSQF